MVVNRMRPSNVCPMAFTEEENKDRKRATFEFPRIEEKFQFPDWKKDQIKF